MKAQYSEKTEPIYTSPILKFSQLSLLMDPLSSIQFALEYQTAKSQAIQHELGYITNIFHHPENNSLVPGKNLRGIRLRNEYRFYYSSDQTGLGGFYFAPELLFNYLQYEKSATVGRSCSGPFGCAYFEKVDMRVRKQVYAFHPKIGYQWIIGRFVIDFYGGVGYRHVRVKTKDFSGENTDWNEDFFDFEKSPGIYNLPSLSFGMKMGFVLKKREDTSIYRVPVQEESETEEVPYYREDY